MQYGILMHVMWAAVIKNNKSLDALEVAGGEKHGLHFGFSRISRMHTCGVCLSDEEHPRVFAAILEWRMQKPKAEGDIE